VAGPDRTDPAADLNGDGDTDDTLLEVFDTRQPSAGMSVLAPAAQGRGRRRACRVLVSGAGLGNRPQR